jgi:hypothetical protein
VKVLSNEVFYNFDNYTIIHLLLATIIKKGKLKEIDHKIPHSF